jgi:hypothetical protein
MSVSDRIAIERRDNAYIKAYLASDRNKAFAKAYPAGNPKRGDATFNGEQAKEGFRLEPTYK